MYTLYCPKENRYTPLKIFVSLLLVQGDWGAAPNIFVPVWKLLKERICFPLGLSFPLTLVMLNILRCRTHFVFSANQIIWSGLLLYIHILNGKRCRFRSVGFFRSQLIWIYTDCKGRIYPGSVGHGLRVASIFEKFPLLKRLLMSYLLLSPFGKSLRCIVDLKIGCIL